MSAATEAERGPEKAHVTVDPGMGAFYEWFVSTDRRYRARELVILARLGFKHMQAENKDAAGKDPAASKGSPDDQKPVLPVVSTPAQPPAVPLPEEPMGFDELMRGLKPVPARA